MSEYETLEELVRAHQRLDLSGFVCACDQHTTNYTLDHNAHLADVVRAWLAERAGRDAVLEYVEPAIRTASPLSYAAGPGLRAFLAALDRRPDWPSEGNGADLRAEQPAQVSLADDGAAGLSEAVAELRAIRKLLEDWSPVEKGRRELRTMRAAMRAGWRP
jgi:hypothetical protein